MALRYSTKLSAGCKMPKPTRKINYRAAYEDMKKQAKFWKMDSAAAWDKCEERRIQAVELAKALEHTKNNLILAVRGSPIRDCDETIEHADRLIEEFEESNK